MKIHFLQCVEAVLKSVILHIGLHKTGTTAIQHAFSGYDDGTTIYGRFGDPNHGNAVIAALTKRKTGDPRYAGDRTEIARKLNRFKIWVRMQSHLYRPDRERLILSGESMCMFAPDEKRDLVDYFRNKGLHVQVVCYVREPLGLSASRFQELVKQGRGEVTPDALSFRKFISPFAEVLPQEDLIVRDFGAEVAEHGDIVGSFANVFGLQRPNFSQNINVSLSAVSVKLLFRCNQMRTRALHLHVRALDKIKRELRQVFPSGEFPSLDKHAMAQRLDASLDENLEYLRAEFGIDYPSVDRVYDLSAVNAYLSDFEHNPLPALRAIAQKWGVEVSKDDGWESLLERLYQTALRR
ncbi:MAG: hypothetical protein AAFR98_10220 [Pseudomonadota bacterium]